MHFAFVLLQVEIYFTLLLGSQTRKFVILAFQPNAKNSKVTKFQSGFMIYQRQIRYLLLE